VISCFDASILILLFDAKANAPIDEATGEPVTYCQERLRYLLQQHSKTKGARIIIPTPALGEFLVRTSPETTQEYLGQVQRLRGSKVAPFAERAAIEFADMQRTILGEGRRRPARADVESRAKAKFDQQIVAIARAEGASTIYTDDKGLSNYAKRFGIESIGVASLPLSPESRQGSLPLEPPEPLSPVEDDE
jgi:hypothetical protein